MNRKILIVDDDQKSRALLKTYLERSQFDVLLAADGASFMTEFERFEHQLSLVILDVMLPDTDGFALCAWVRKRSQLPIIMLTASSDDTDKIVGLELGADDYLGKPYNPRELLARIKAIGRRSGMDAALPRVYRFAGFVLDVIERTLTAPDGSDIKLTGMDFQLLRYLVEHPGEVIDRNVLAEQTRGRELGPLDRTLDVQVSRLRQKLASGGELIKTVRGAGYVFSTDVTASHD
ncbi:response regulator [Chitinibacteraceae bacterium HSL-7]